MALVSELEALVATYPLRERLRGQLMLALHRSGRSADALGRYQEGCICRDGGYRVAPGGQGQTGQLEKQANSG